MMTTHRIGSQYSERESIISAATYCAIIVSIIVIAAISVAGLFDAYSSASTSMETLARMEGRVVSPPPTDMSAPRPPDAPQGSAFLEGDTMTVAGASLLQRVTSAVSRTGGFVLSSQIELQTSASGRIGLVVSAEMDPSALQGFLYDIERGMPFLFVDQLLVQAPSRSQDADGGHARITITVLGQWRSTR